MNYYNPYFMSYPYQAVASTPGLFSRLTSLGRGGISLSSILSGTGKTLNTINQAIPLVRQARPLFNNAKTMFRLMNEFKKVDTPTQSSNNSTINETLNSTPIQKKEEIIPASSTNGPTFFL